MSYCVTFIFAVLELLSHAASHRQILEDCPFLEPDDILAVWVRVAHETKGVNLPTRSSGTLWPGS